MRGCSAVRPVWYTAGMLTITGADLVAAGAIVTPGLVNAHRHLLQTALRTLPGTRGRAAAHRFNGTPVAPGRTRDDFGRSGVVGDLTGVTAGHRERFFADCVAQSLAALREITEFRAAADE